MTKKRWFAILIFIQVVVASLIIVKWPDNRLHVITCDVGQGDAILISYRFQQMLIDGGRDEKVLDCLNHYMPMGDRTIEVVVATHADADHIAGLAQVLESFKVLKLISTQQGKQTDDFKRFWELVQVEKSTGMRLIYPQPQQVVWLVGPLSAKVVSTSGSRSIEPPLITTKTETRLSDVFTQNKKKTIDYNDGSIVVLLQFGEQLFLFTGDLEKTGELALIKTGLLRRVNVLKVGHHGSKSSSGRAFLGVLRPEITLISVGEANQYGHPSPQVIQRLLEVGANTYRTDQQGNIEVVADGSHLFVKTQK